MRHYVLLFSADTRQQLQALQVYLAPLHEDVVYYIDVIMRLIAPGHALSYIRFRIDNGSVFVGKASSISPESPPFLDYGATWSDVIPFFGDNPPHLPESIDRSEAQRRWAQFVADVSRWVDSDALLQLGPNPDGPKAVANGAYVTKAFSRRYPGNPNFMRPLPLP